MFTYFIYPCGFIEDKIGGKGLDGPLFNEYGLLLAHAANTSLDEGAEFLDSAGDTGMAVRRALIRFAQIRMGIELENGQSGKGSLYCLYGSQSNTVLSAQYDRDLPVHQNIRNHLTDGCRIECE